MNETIYLKKLEHAGNQTDSHTSAYSKNHDAAQRSIFTVGFGKRIGYGRQINHLPHHNPFLAHHLIHGIDDGTGSLKYAVCSNDCNCEVDDLHTHFYCENCHRTFCMKSIHVPIVTLPPGFTVQSINYVLKGLCSECSHQHI